MPRCRQWSVRALPLVFEPPPLWPVIDPLLVDDEPTILADGFDCVGGDSSITFGALVRAGVSPYVFVGLIGYYPRVAEEASRLSLGGVGSAGIAWVAWTVTLLAAIFVDVTSERTFADPGSWAPPLLTVAFVLALLSFLCYGVASTWSETPSRTLGVLLLVPVAAFLGQAVLLALKIVTGEVTAVLQLAFGALIAIALFVISYLLWTDTKRAVSSESRVDPTA